VVALTHSDGIEVKRVQGKGRGVFARRLIRQGEVIERVPVLVLATEEVKDCQSWAGLAGYCFLWGKGTLALALGYGSLYNHSYHPNARYDDEGAQTKVFTALRDIAAGEEITVNYNGEPDDQTPVGFKVVMGGRSHQQPECPEAQSRNSDESAHGNPHRNLSLVDNDVPAESESDSMKQCDHSADDP
jgi:SET domain-containing protein